MKKFLHHAWFYPALLVLMWAVAVICVDPRGEFPVNDDWAYSKNVKSLVVDGKFYVDEWPAMTLISQTLYGSAATAIFGFSFTVLRCSVLLLGILSTLVLFFLLKMRSADAFVAFILSAGFCFSQLFFALSFTYMTDVFFLSFVIFSLYQLIRYLDYGKRSNYILYCVFSLVAVLNRQQGLLLPVLIIAPLLLQQKFSFRNLLIALGPLLICVGGHLGYRRFLEAMDIHDVTWGTNKLLENMKTMEFYMLHWHAGDTILFSGLLLFPMSVYLWMVPATFNWKKLLGIVLSACCLLVLAWNTFPIFPSGNISNISYVGPRQLKDFYENFVNIYQLSKLQRWAVIALAFVSAVTMLSFVFSRRTYVVNADKKKMYFNLSLLLFAIIYYVFSVFNPAYIDRYVLPFALVLLILCTQKRLSLSVYARIPLTLVVVVIFLFSVFTEKDYMNWHRARWQAVQALESEGVSPHGIDGGFEYGGWHQPGAVNGASDSRSWWWVDQDSFLVANGDYPGFTKQQFFTYQQYVPYVTDTIYILKKKIRSSEDFERMLEIENRIRKDSVWLAGIKKQATDLKLPLDTVLRMNSKWILDNEKTDKGEEK